MKILLVEDEVNVLSFVKRGLEEEGYKVTAAMDGNSAVELVDQSEFDLILLDIMLPGKSGLEVCREIRQRGITVPVIMLTALGDTNNIIIGLDLGADDYLVKPFEFNELLARIRSVSRRNSSKPMEPNLLSIGDLRLDTDTKTVTRAGKMVPLTATEFRLLEFMMRNQRRVLSRMDILENVWGVHFDMGTNVVDVYVNYLRKKIDKDTGKLIHTMIGMGYVLKESNEAEG